MKDLLLDIKLLAWQKLMQKRGLEIAENEPDDNAMTLVNTIMAGGSDEVEIIKESISKKPRSHQHLVERWLLVPNGCLRVLWIEEYPLRKRTDQTFVC